MYSGTELYEKSRVDGNTFVYFLFYDYFCQRYHGTLINLAIKTNIFYIKDHPQILIIKMITIVNIKERNRLSS